MHLSQVEIKNFRSLKELTVNLQPGLNVLVGRNNTGKTNLLQAIRHALGASASRGDSLWLERDDFYKESAKDETERVISITLTFTGLSEVQRSYFFEIVDFNLADIEKSKAIIRLEVSWPKGKRQASIKRTGGVISADAPEVPSNLLHSLPITFLPALRDAEALLAPGNRSRLARLLEDLAEQGEDGVKVDIEQIYIDANTRLEEKPLISQTKESLQSTALDLAGSDYSRSAIKAAEVKFEKILRSLQLQMDDGPLGGLDANGLGYNNLLYTAVVLQHLNSFKSDESPLLLVEEPEAHLHPQLTLLLADYLAKKIPGKGIPQTIVTTHSPTLAASVPPNCVHVMFSVHDKGIRQSRCNSVANAGLLPKEENELQRMMDVTRATLYFAKAAILVEGISESLLVPVLARRLGYDLAKLHISVIPICGVAFETFKKLLAPAVLGIPIAIVTDADPPITQGDSWESDMPQSDSLGFARSDRTKKLMGLFVKHSTVKVFPSKLTLEYDLAKAGEDNAEIMAEVWESCFEGPPRTFNKSRVQQAGNDLEHKALVAWRGICRSSADRYKAEFSHRLAAFLDASNGSGLCPLSFRVPQYLQEAIEYVVTKATSLAVPFGGTNA